VSQCSITSPCGRQTAVRSSLRPTAREGKFTSRRFQPRPVNGKSQPEEAAVFLGGEAGTLPGEGAFSRDGKWLAFAEYSTGKRRLALSGQGQKPKRGQRHIGFVHNESPVRGPVIRSIRCVRIQQRFVSACAVSGFPV